MSRQNIAYYGNTNYYKEGDRFWTEKEFSDDEAYEVDLGEIQQVLIDDETEYYKDTLDYLAEIDSRLVTPVYLPTQLVAIMQQAADNEDENLIEWLLAAIHAQLDAIEEEKS